MDPYILQQVAQMMHVRDVFAIRKTCREARELCDFMWLDPRTQRDSYDIINIALYNLPIGSRLFRAKIADVIANSREEDYDYRVYYIIAHMRIRARTTGSIVGLRELVLMMIEVDVRTCDLLNLLRARERIRGKNVSTILGERERFDDTREVAEFYCMWREQGSEISLCMGFVECLRSVPNLDVLQFALEDTKNYTRDMHDDEEDFRELGEFVINLGVLSPNQIHIWDHDVSSSHKGGFTRVVVR